MSRYYVKSSDMLHLMEFVGVLIVIVSIQPSIILADIDYNTINEDGSYRFRHTNDDVGGFYHSASATADNLVRGRYGARNPASGKIEETIYTAGKRGFRANSPQIHRKMDLAQYPPGPRGSPDDPLADPYDVPTYSFNFRLSDQSRTEDSDASGRIRGLYSYLDDEGERHSVRYAAGAETGFEVTNAVPDNPARVSYTSPLYKADPNTRGKMTVQRGPGGSYKLIAAGPDHRRAESRAPDGLVRGTYSFLDDKGVQRTVEYVAGAGIGYRVVQNRIGPGTHINPSVSDFRLTDTDFRLANEFGHRIGSGTRLGSAASAASPSSVSSSGTALGSSSVMSTTRRLGSTSGIGSSLPSSSSSSSSDENHMEFDEEYLTKSDDGKMLDSTKNRDKDNSKNRMKGEDDAEEADTGENEENIEISGRHNMRGKIDRIDIIKGQRGDSRYGGSSGGGHSSSDRGFMMDRDLNKIGSYRPSSNRNSLSTNQRMRNRIKNGGHGNRGSGSSYHHDRTSSSPSSSSSSSSSLPSSSSSSSVFSSSNNYNLNDDDVVGPLPPLITANRKVLEIDRERDWVERHRDSTIIKNAGKWYIGLPPGQSVRAHVQNIDILPLGGRRVPSPSEALRQDEVDYMVAAATAYRS